MKISVLGASMAPQTDEQVAQRLDRLVGLVFGVHRDLMDLHIDFRIARFAGARAVFRGALTLLNLLQRLRDRSDRQPEAPPPARCSC